jgi:hypothetical protein
MGIQAESDNPWAVTMNTDKTVTATFTLTNPLYTLTVDTEGEGAVDVAPPCCTYDEGQDVQLVAEAAAGWTFSHWSELDNQLSSESPITISMYLDRTITATFTQITLPQYTIRGRIEGEGSVSLDPPGRTYDQGTEVLLQAQPHTDWRFGHWTVDGFTIVDNPLTITMDSDKTITASFIYDKCETVVDAVPEKKEPNIMVTVKIKDEAGCFVDTSSSDLFFRRFRYKAKDPTS